MHNTKNKAAKFRLTKSEINQFAVFEENYKNINGQFDIKSVITFNFDIESATLSCSCEVNCLKENLLIVRAEVTLHYEISNETIGNLTHNNAIIIPKQLLAYWGSNTYSTLRGVIMAKLESTQVRLILPLNNLSNIIAENLTISIPTE